MSYRRFGTKLGGGKPRPRRHGLSLNTASSSAHGGLSTLHKTLTTKSAVARSDGKKYNTQSGNEPVSISIPSCTAGQDRPYYGSGRDKQLGRRGPTPELRKTRVGAGSKVHLPKPSPVPNNGFDGLLKYHMPQGVVRILRDAKKVPNPTRESEQMLEDVLDYWNAQKYRPLHGAPRNFIKYKRPSWGSGGILSHIARSMKVQTASHTHESGETYSSKLLPLETRRTIRSASARLTAAAPTQSSITPGELPANLLPRFEVGSKTPIRQHLRLWQEQNHDEETDVKFLADYGKPGGVENILTRPADSDTMLDTMDNEENEGPWPEATMDLDGVTEFDSGIPFLRCGDLVELSPSNGSQESVLAIYIRAFDTQAQFYTIHGKWIHRLPKAVYFAIPGFVPRSMVAEIQPYLPTDEVGEDLQDKLHTLDVSVPREMGSPIVNAIRRFSNASEAAYRRHSSSLDNAHDLVAHETEIKYMTLPEIATKLLPPSAKQDRSRPWPQSTLYALHRILLRNEFGFGVDRTGHRISAKFEIRPKEEVRSVNQVRSWLREYQEQLVTDATTDKPDTDLRDTADTTNTSDTTSPDAADSHPLAMFVSTARQLISESREHRVPTEEGNVGPSPVRFSAQKSYTYRTITSIRFSETDKSILSFFEIWAGYRSFFRHVPLNSLASMILRVIGMYEGYELDHKVGWLFLQELGVYAPWENRMILSHQLGLPGHKITLEADQLRLKNIQFAKSNPILKDSMQAYRKDFGNLEVFCVDHADAREIDDGISVEEVPGSKTVYWIHVHVANPSAFISPESTLAKYAEYLTETVYLPERIYTMLPPNITSSRWSLGPSRPTLTFSAKMNRDGDILEAKITPAYIRNVSYCTPETIREALAEGNQTMPQTVITVGGVMPGRGRKNLQQHLTKSQKHKLRILRDLGSARRRQREEKGAVNVSLPAADTVVYVGPHQDTPLSLTNHSRGAHFEGDPIIQLRGEHFSSKPDPSISAADKLVPDLMILACEAAALWCKERNIPTLYRATQHNPDYDPNDFRKQFLEPTIEKLGYLPLVLSFQYSRRLGRSLVTTRPRPHGVIGADQYVKCTSPLRRYGDLLVHWQIESAIRREVKLGHTLVGSENQSYLTFSKEGLEEMIPRIQSRERMITGVKRHSLRHWTVQLLFRAFYFKEAALPETFECFIFSKGASKYAGLYSGILKELGIDVQVDPTQSAKEIGVDMGDWWEVRITKIDAYVRAVTVEAFRLIEKGEDYFM